jgi:hypothetical protein
MDAAIREAEGEDAGRAARAEAAEDGGVGDAAEPARGDESGAHEPGRRVEAEQNLGEQVVVAEHGRDRARPLLFVSGTAVSGSMFWIGPKTRSRRVGNGGGKEDLRVGLDSLLAALVPI